jgi:hypothetical protein
MHLSFWKIVFSKVVILMRDKQCLEKRGGANSSVQDIFILRFIRSNDRGLSRGYRKCSGKIFEKRFFQKHMQRWIMSFWRIISSKVVILMRKRNGAGRKEDTIGTNRCVFSK